MEWEKQTTAIQFWKLEAGWMSGNCLVKQPDGKLPVPTTQNEPSLHYRILKGSGAARTKRRRED